MYNIVTVTFKDSNTATANGVRQWDYGQILRIQGLQLPTAVEVHFALIDSKDSVTRIGTTKDGVTDVVIPDSMIEAGKNIFAYVYLRDSESGQTEYEVKIVVTTRAKPEAFDTPEDEELFAQAIEAVNTAADRAEKAGQTAQEAAGQAAEDAQQTAEDRKEVAKMVETVSDISEQVKKVEQLSQQAQDAADKTEADAQQTAEDRVEVGKMLETVRDVSEQVKSVEESVRKAKESEQAAAGHRTAVEQMKESVEQTASTFPQKVQEGVQAVENAGASEVQEITQAGTAQKTAVEAAGTQAVESVENVQQVATEAVETAKTEAVQAVQTEGTTQTGNVTTEGTKQVKSVQDKGAEVLQSIPEDFPTQMETKLDKQQGIENKGKTLVIGEDGNVVPGEVASGGGDGIAIINTMSGESPLVIPDSAERPLERLELGGKTEQVQTTGAQLFEASRYEGVTKNGVTVTVKDGVITATGTTETDIWIQLYVTAEEYKKLFKPGEKIYIKTQKSSDCNYDFGIYGSFGSPALGTIREGNSGAALPTELPANDTSFYFFLDIKKGSALKGSIKPIVYHNGNGTWEPYTGGKPSPSPEYPQKIKNVGKWNEGTQKYEVDVKITGKNLLNLQKEPDVKGLYQGWKVGNGDKGTLSIKDKGNNADISECYFGLNSDGTTSYSVTWLVDNGVIKRYHTESIEKMYACMYPPNETIIKKNTERFEIQYEYGSIATEYQPYKEQTLTLTSDRPITKWDRLVEQSGEIGWLYQSAINEYRGDTVIAIYGTGFYFLLNNKKLKSGEGYCEELKQHVPRDEKPCISFVMSTNTYAYTLNTQAIYGSTVSAIKEYLKTHPLHLVYKTETTEFVPLPQEEQDAIRALKTYYPTTVITADGGELYPDIKVTYTADTKNYIDGKVSAKVASILRQYQADTANLLSLMPMETQAAMIENDTNNILNNLESEETHE